MRECQFTVLECPAVGGADEVIEALAIFQMTVHVGLQPIYAMCHCRVWSEVADINKSVLAFHEETQDERFYLFV